MSSLTQDDPPLCPHSPRMTPLYVLTQPGSPLTPLYVLTLEFEKMPQTYRQTDPQLFVSKIRII